MLVSAESIAQAATRIHHYLTPTPLIYSPHFSQRIGANVYLKLDMLQPTHSFKVRGALNAVLSLPEEQRAKGVVTASQGNHGMGVAYAARTLGVTATVYLPTVVLPDRVRTLRDLGAEIVISGDSFDEASRGAREFAASAGCSYIHAFDDPTVMAGQGTIVPELVEQLPKIDLIAASVGGGGLLSGIISAAQHYLPGTRVAGVETVGADCMYLSKEAGQIVELPAITSIAISLGARKPGQQQFDIITNYASDLAVVSDKEAVAVLLEMLGEEKLLVEPAASCTLAALISKRITVQPGDNVVAIVCGANQSIEDVRRWAITG